MNVSKFVSDLSLFLQQSFIFYLLGHNMFYFRKGLTHRLRHMVAKIMKEWIKKVKKKYSGSKGVRSSKKYWKYIIWQQRLFEYQGNLYNVLKAFWHPPMLQTNGFAFVCARTWIFKLYDVRKALSHDCIGHLNLYSPVMLTQV